MKQFLVVIFMAVMAFILAPPVLAQACPQSGEAGTTTTCGTETYNVCSDDKGVNSSDSRFCQDPNSKFSCSFSGNHNCSSGFVYSCSACPQATSVPVATRAPTAAPVPTVSSSCPSGDQAENYSYAQLKQRCTLLQLSRFNQAILVDFDNQTLIDIGNSTGDLGNFLGNFPSHRLYGGAEYEGKGFSIEILNQLPCSTIQQMPGHIQSQIPKDCSVGGASPTDSPVPIPTTAADGAIGSECSYQILDRDTLTEAETIQGGKPYIFRINMTNKTESTWNTNYKLQATDDTEAAWNLSKGVFKISDPESKKKQDIVKDSSVIFDIPAQARTSDKAESLAFNFRMSTDTDQPFGAACEPQDIVVQSPSAMTKCYAISEDEGTINSIADCTDSRAQTYTEHPLKIPYTLTGEATGPKRIFVKFFPTSGLPLTFQKTITYAPGPKLTQIECIQSATGQGTVVNIKGENLGEHAEQGIGKVTIGDLSGQIINWKGAEGSITASAAEKLEGENAVEVTIDDGRVAMGTCTVGVTTVELTALMQCRRPGEYAVENVDIKIFEYSPEADPKQPLISQKVSIDADGVIQGFAPKVQKDKKYVAIVKAPGTLAKKIVFDAKGGTTKLDPITLLVGDISPDTGGVSKINAFDKSKLISQWNPVSDSVRTGDFNGDGRVNTIDWSCMRPNTNQGDDVFIPPVTVDPLPLSATIDPTISPTVPPVEVPTQTPIPTPTDDSI